MLKEHSPGRWHGYIEESINKRHAAKNALSRAGLIDPKNGKVIKRK